ncbi:hypothetical protein PGB90_004568 [Kerria lacca]
MTFCNRSEKNSHSIRLPSYGNSVFTDNNNSTYFNYLFRSPHCNFFSPRIQKLN